MSNDDSFSFEEKFAIGAQRAILLEPCTVIQKDAEQSLDLSNTSFKTCEYYCDESSIDINPKGTIIKHDQHEFHNDTIVFVFPGDHSISIRLTDMYFVRHENGFKIFTFKHSTYNIQQIYEMFNLAFSYIFRDWIVSVREYTWVTLKKALDETEAFESLEKTKYQQLRDDFSIQYRNDFESRFYNFWYQSAQQSYQQLYLSLDQTSPYCEFKLMIKDYIFNQVSNQIFCTTNSIWSMFKYS